MRVSKRVYVNLLVFLVASFLLVYLGARSLVFQQAEEAKYFLKVEDASGLLPRNDVTMRGVVVGSIRNVELADDGHVRVMITLEPGADVPQGTIGEVVRRSPIGELTLELDPGEGPALAAGSTIGVKDTVPPPDVSKTIEVLADVLHEVPSEDLTTVVSELSTAVRGRGEDLARFSVDAADLPERILDVATELEQLIETGPEVTGVLADNASVLADDLTQTKLLADILRDRRYDLVDLYRNGGDFTTVASDLIAAEKANLSCLIDDFGKINSVLALPHNLANLAATLTKNHFFFGGVEQAVRVGKDEGTWFRVQLVPPAQPHARIYPEHREAPDAYPGNACRSIFGPGVGPVTQPEPPD
ncbi:MAG: MlaD family protein, partial [Actinomycetota bacterium]